MAKTTPRKNDLQVVHTIARVLNFNDADIAAAYVGTMPKGAVVVSTDFYVTTAFNAGSVNNVSVGSQLVLNELLSSATAAAGSTGVKLNNNPLASPYLVDLTADQDVYASYNSSGSAASAGRGVIVVRFVPHTTT